jgi:hypothetical protein
MPHGQPCDIGGGTFPGEILQNLLPGLCIALPIGAKPVGYGAHGGDQIVEIRLLKTV